MSFAYTDIGDAIQHLNHTVVMYDGRPVFVGEMFDNGQGEYMASITDLPRNRNAVNVSIFDPLFDPRGARLGYTNTHNGYAVYLSRIPARQYKQGLCRQNVNIPVGPGGTRVTSYDHLFISPQWADSLRGIYPTYDEAVALLKTPEIHSVAFNRFFAVELDELGFIRLLYRGEACAFGETDTFRLPKQFEYLKEEIMELGVKVYGNG